MLEATSIGGLEIESTIDNAGGEILAAAHTAVLLTGADVQGGILATTGSGAIEVAGEGATLDGSKSLVRVDGDLNVSAGATLTILGSVTVQAASANAGAIAVDGGALTLKGALSGSGLATIDGGSLTFDSTSGQTVEFLGGGELSLARSAWYDGDIVGFSTSGSTSLDLRDIAFIGSGEVTFSGDAAGGYLTVGSGAHVASIYLSGDYLDATFTAASDGAHGTVITARQTTFAPSEAKDTVEPGPSASTVNAAPDARGALTDLDFKTLVATFHENAAGPQGVFGLADERHAADIILFGQFAAANDSGSAASAGFVTATDTSHGAAVTLGSLASNSPSVLKD